MTPIEKILQGAAAGKYGDDSDAIGKMAGIIMSARFEQGYGPFISGVLGERGPDGHYAGYIVCPSYGSDAWASKIFAPTSTPPACPSRSIPAGEPPASEPQK